MIRSLLENNRWHHLLKGTMLEGKHNHRMDNLIWVLLHKVIPHFHAKHQCQQFGFEGPNLEIQCQNEAETNTHTFTLDDIKILVEGQYYLVHSQSDLTHRYNIDIDNYTCECDVYLSISYCKHICAVQLLFTESLQPCPFTSIYTPPNGIESYQGDPDLSTPIPKADIAQAHTTADTATFVQLSDKLQALAIHTCLATPQSFTTHFNVLRLLLDLLLEETKAMHILPKPTKIALNESSGWAETKAVMHQPVKLKFLYTHMDPYSTGKASKTMAKPDVKRAKKEKVKSDTRYEYHLLVHFFP